MENNRVLAYLDSLENKVKRLVSEHEDLKRALIASMEENRNLSMNLQNLEDEVQNLNIKRADSGFEKEDLEEELDFLKSENKSLMEALEKVQEHIRDVQTKSEQLLDEFDKVKEENTRLTNEREEIEQAYVQHLNSVNEYRMERDQSVLESESLKIQLEAFKTKNQDLRAELEKLEESSKNFHNQEKNSKIVESIAEGSTDTHELKLKINEYIKEIDKCISQLSD